MNIEKECVYTDTFEFAGYYEITTGTTQGKYIIIYHDLGKDGPYLEYIDNNNSNINLKIGESYEISFKKNIYLHKNKLKESKIITKIEHTNNKGMSQKHEECLLN